VEFVLIRGLFFSESTEASQKYYVLSYVTLWSGAIYSRQFATLDAFSGQLQPKSNKLLVRWLWLSCGEGVPRKACVHWWLR
jgi:hypothetical protein